MGDKNAVSVTVKLAHVFLSNCVHNNKCKWCKTNSFVVLKLLKTMTHQFKLQIIQNSKKNRVLFYKIKSKAQFYCDKKARQIKKRNYMILKTTNELKQLSVSQKANKVVLGSYGALAEGAPHLSWFKMEGTGGVFPHASDFRLKSQTKSCDQSI